MPDENEFLQAEIIAATALGILEREIVLPSFLTRLAGAEFAGAKDDTITVRIPARLDAREYNWRSNRDEIELDFIEELGVPVVLDTMPYSAVAVTDEQLTLDITNFAERVVGPQARAMVRHMEQKVATTIEGANFAWEIDEADPFKAAAKARAALNKASVPVDGRALVLGADVETAYLSSPLLVRADTSGSDRALRDANIGRIAGFETYVSQFIDPDTAFAIHRSAFALANMAPVVPEGVPSGGSQTYSSYAVRWFRDYDAMHLRDRSVLSSFIGCSSVEDGVQLGEDHKGENVRVVKLSGIQEPE